MIPTKISWPLEIKFKGDHPSEDEVLSQLKDQGLDPFAHCKEQFVVEVACEDEDHLYLYAGAEKEEARTRYSWYYLVFTYGLKGEMVCTALVSMFVNWYQTREEFIEAIKSRKLARFFDQFFQR